MSLIKNRESILKYHNFQSIKDSLDALDFAFENSSPERLVDKSITIGSIIQVTDINRKLYQFKLPKANSILVISVGKASETMLSGLTKK